MHYHYPSSEEEKERHSSGESVDSLYSESNSPDSETESQNGEEMDQYDENALKSTNVTISTKSLEECNLQGDNVTNLANTYQPGSVLDSIEQEDKISLWHTKNKVQPKGILKRCVRRCFSESHATSQASINNLDWSNSILDVISSPASDSPSSSEENGVIDDFAAQKKSVRFNEVVQRQIFRSNSSILKQKRKSEKRTEQRLKKRGSTVNMKERRASEGDAESLLDAGFKLSSSFEKSIMETNGYSSSENGSVSPSQNSGFGSFKGASKERKNPQKPSTQFDDTESHTDSGIASSYDEHVNNTPPMIKNMEKIPEESLNESPLTNNETSKISKKTKKNKKNKLTRGKSHTQGQFIKESNSDLIFDLDF